MKVKIFRGNITMAMDYQNIENNVNNFINDKKVIDIKQSIQTCEILDDAYFLVITVMYED